MTDNDQSRRSETERSIASDAAPRVSRRGLLLAAATAGAVGVPGRVGGTRSGAEPTGAVTIDGSEAHRRPSAAVAETVRRERSGVELSVEDSGTAEGFRRFATGEVDAHVAGRPMLPSERERAVANGVAFERVELPLGGAALVHSRREWYDCVRPRRLVETWSGDAEVETYAELADATGAESTAEAESAVRIESNLETGPGAVLRSDPGVTAPSDDASVVARGTREFQYERGFGGLGYYEPTAADVRSLAAVGREESYTPLVRLAFLYLDRASGRRAAIDAFERAYRDRAARTTGDVTYFAAPADAR